jgi:hypothetical protein
MQLTEIKKAAPEAIFLALNTDMIINTAPQIAYYGIEDVQLLGLDYFKDERVPRLGERYVDNAIFAALAPCDSIILKEFNRGGFKEDNFILLNFFQTLMSLKEIKNYQRHKLPILLANLVKEKNLYHIYKIQNGEFVDLEILK